MRIDTPETEYFELPEQARLQPEDLTEWGMKVPMQSLVAFTGANYQVPGSLTMPVFFRRQPLCTNDVREKGRAFERVVFNVIFINRDDHPKLFAYLMSANGTGRWRQPLTLHSVTAQAIPSMDASWAKRLL
jgi:serine/threonine-protein kinase HipA